MTKIRGRRLALLAAATAGVGSTLGLAVAAHGQDATSQVESAFANAENLRYNLFAPPAARSVTFEASPVMSSVTSTATEQGVLYPDSLRSSMLADAQNALNSAMGPTLANDVYTHVSNFTKNDFGPHLSMIGGEGADVLSYDQISISGTTAHLEATVRIWSKVGSLTSSAASEIPAVGQTVTPSSAAISWQTIQSHMIVDATMTQGSDGNWRETSMDSVFAPGWEP